jgi:hypothetical protein
MNSLLWAVGHPIIKLPIKEFIYTWAVAVVTKVCDILMWLLVVVLGRERKKHIYMLLSMKLLKPMLPSSNPS